MIGLKLQPCSNVKECLIIEMTRNLCYTDYNMKWRDLHAIKGQKSNCAC